MQSNRRLEALLTLIAVCLSLIVLKLYTTDLGTPLWAQSTSGPMRVELWSTTTAGTPSKPLVYGDATLPVQAKAPVMVRIDKAQAPVPVWFEREQPVSLVGGKSPLPVELYYQESYSGPHRVAVSDQGELLVRSH